MKLKKSLAAVLTSTALFSMCAGTMAEASKKVPLQICSDENGREKGTTEEIFAMAKKVQDNLYSEGLWRKIKTIKDEILWQKNKLIEKEKKANKKELKKFKQAQEKQLENLKLKHSEELKPIEQKIQALDNQKREFWRTLPEDIAKKNGTACLCN